MPVTFPAVSALPPRKTLRPEPLGQHLPPLKSPRLLAQLRERLRFLRYSLRTEEGRQVLRAMVGEHQLLAPLLYGCGLRITEAPQLQVKDVDFGQRALLGLLKRTELPLCRTAARAQSRQSR